MLSVIIRTYNEAAHIGRLFDGIEQQTITPDQVIVVDSGSSDGTAEIARARGAEIHAIAPAEFTFGRSLNRGCAAATGDIVVIASAHVRPVLNTWLERLVEPLGDELVALAYGRQVGDRTTKFSEHQVLAKWFPERSEPRQSHPFCNNANAAIRRSLWLRRTYDESLTGLEDLDWAHWAMQEGWAISYVAAASVVHLHDESTQQTANRYRREAIAHQRIFHDQRMSLPRALTLAGGNIAMDYWHAAREGVLASNLAGIPLFRAAQFWGAYQGFKQRGPVSRALQHHFYYPRKRAAVPFRADTDADGRRIDYRSSPGDRDA